jgi:predicted dehydrogenase
MKPKLGFAGVGWIGRSRLEAIVRSGLAEPAAIYDPSPAAADEALRLLPRARVAGSFEELIDADLDGVVIATPSALHAAQCDAALERGLAVFCQKPLGRTAAETREVVDRAKRKGRLLGVDFSYRFVEAVRAVTDLVRSGELGEVYAADLVFHNAYGPDKPWFYDRERSGGGCVIDLGIHLVDLLLWSLRFPRVAAVTSRLLQKGKRFGNGPASGVEDYAEVRLDLENGAVARLSCSWNLPAGCDAAIGASFFGTKGGAVVRNVNGSFYDFAAEHCVGTRRRALAGPPDAWGGRAAVEWTRRLAAREGFDAACEETVSVAETIESIYRAAG